MAFLLGHIQTLTGTTPTWDVAMGYAAKITAAGNTAITLSGIAAPSGGWLHFKQNDTGGKTLTINGISQNVDTAPNATTRIEFSYDGSDYCYGSTFGTGTSSASSLGTPSLIITADGTTLYLKWNDISNSVSYTVQRATDSGFTTGLTTVTGLTASNYTDSTTAAATTYYYRVKAVGNGTTYLDGSYSATITSSQQTGTALTGWTSSNSSFTISTNTLTKTTSTSITAQAITSKTLASGVNGWVEFTIDFNSQVQTAVIAFDKESGEVSAFTAIDHGIYSTTTNVSIIMAGAASSMGYAPAATHRLRLERYGTNMYYKYFDGTTWQIVATYAVATAGAFNVKAWGPTGVASTKLSTINAYNVA